jgi:hypothetical protein
MRLSAVIAALFALTAWACAAFGQPPPDASSGQWNPGGLPGFGFEDAAIVKIYTDASGNDVLGLIVFQEVPVRYTVQKCRTEQRTRTVTDPETGETTEQHYTVQVPYVEELERMRLRQSRKEVPLQHAQFWKVSGETMSHAEAQAALRKPTRCFLIDRPSHANIGPFFSQMFKESVLLVAYDETQVNEIAMPSTSVNNKDS